MENIINKNKFNLFKLNKEENLYKFLCYALISIIFFNSIWNLFFQNRQDVFSNINLYDFIIGISLFICLCTVGNTIKKQFNFESVSIGIIFYLFSFFIFDCFALFFYQKLEFLDVLYLVNVLWLLFFVVKIKNLKNIIDISA